MTNYQPAPSTHSSYLHSRQLRRGLHLLTALSMAVVLLTAVYSWISSSFSAVSPVSAQSENLVRNNEFADWPDDWIVNGDVDFYSEHYGRSDVVHLNGPGYIQQNNIVPSEPITGIYRLWADYIYGDLEYTLESSNEFVAPSTNSWSLTTTWVVDSQYLLLLSDTYELIFSDPDSGYLDPRIDKVGLEFYDAVADMDTGLIQNGEFIGLGGWEHEGEVYHVMDIGASDVITYLGATSLFLDTGQGFPEVSLYQVVVPSETGVYELSFECKKYSGGGSKLKYEIASAQPHVVPAINDSCTSSTSQWTSFSSPYLLEAGVPYTVTFTLQASDLVPKYLLDNVALLKIYDAMDYDTGLIQNGDFIGPDEWLYSTNAKYHMTVGQVITELGAIELYKPGGMITQTNITVMGTEPITSVLSLICQADDLYDAAVISYTLQSSNPQEPVVNDQIACGIAMNGWTTYTSEIWLTPGETYTFLLQIDNPASSNDQVYVDNISLPDPNAAPPPTEELWPLRDEMVSSDDGTCAVSACQPARGEAQGIDTISGNNRQEITGLNVPVVGDTLQFNPQYASGGLQYYNTTLSSLGGGWTHEYETQLHFEDTTLSGTVELQTPTGDLLPFFITYTGSFTTYEAYPGVTADLTFDPILLEYTVVGFNQTEYHFNQAGQLIEQIDPDGNSIQFVYENGRLTTAIQGTRFLSYAYNPEGRLQTVTDHTGRSVQLGYTDGNLTSFTNPLGLATEYVYSGTTGLLTQVQDPTGRIVKTVLYDEENRAYHLTDGSNKVLADIDYAPSAVNGLTETVVIENGVTTIHRYDERRTLVETTPSCSGVAGCGATSHADHDDNFKANEVRDANNNQTTLAWNEEGGSSNLEGVTNALNQSTGMVYDDYNNLTRVTDALGHTTVYTYSNNPAIPTFLVASRDALGNITIYTPTIAGVNGDTISGLLKATRDPNGNVTTYQYNSFGQVTQVVTAANTPDALTTTYEYDAIGRLIVSTQTSAAESHKSLNVYNAGDQLIATIANWTGSNPADWETNCLIPAVSADTNVCTRYGYDAAGRPISTTNALGQTDLTLYDRAGRVVTNVVNYNGITPFNLLCTDFSNPDPEYNICSLAGYDEFGRVVTSTDSLGHQTVTEYNPLGRVNRTILNWENGVYNAAFPDEDIITGYEYDAAGNMIITTDALGRKTRTFYDVLNRVAGTISNWQNNITLSACGGLPEIRDYNVCTLYEYDAVGNTIIVTNTLGRMTRTFYDELNRVQVTVANWQTGFTPAQCVYAPNNNQAQNICTLVGYDAAGRQTTITNALNQTSLTVYDKANRPVVQVTNWDKTTSILPDGTGCANTEINPAATQNLCTFTNYDSLGRRESTTDVLGLVTTFAYDGLGRVLTTTTTPLHNSSFIIHNSYDALGNRLTQTDAENHTTTYTYDSLNRLKTTTSQEGVVITQTYNAAGWLMSTINNLGHETTYTYDRLGRRRTVTDAENHTTEYIYDALGNQVAMIDPAGVQTSYLYDGLNRLEGVIENNVVGNVPGPETDVLTEYVYDAIGNRVVITNALGFTSSLTTYDDLNRPIIVADALGNQTLISYNALGNRIQVTDGNLEITQYSYDSLNRLKTAAYQADGETVSYQYDARGNTLVMTDSLGLTTYEYDDLGRLLTVTNPFNSAVGYGYNKVGSRIALTYPDGRVVTYTYDGDNRLVGVEDWAEGITTYGYDRIGRLITTTLPNEVQTIYTYDEADRLIGLAHYNLATGDLIADYSYALDNVGNRLTATERHLLPGIPAGTAAAPAGVVQNAPANAAEALAAIQPPDPAKDLVTGKRTPSALASPSSPLALPPSLLTPPSSPLTSTNPQNGSNPQKDFNPQTNTQPLSETLHIDPEAVIEQAENTIQTPPGETPYVAQETHEVTFEEGSITFVAITETTSISQTATLSPLASLPSPFAPLSSPLTLTVALAEIAVGGQPLFVGPDTNVPDFEANIARFDLGNGLTEEFIARNAGVEQRWWLENNPNLNGDLTIEVEVVTPLTLTIGGHGFVFGALTAESPDVIPVIQYERAVAIDAAENSYWAHLSAETVSTDADGVYTYRLQMTFPADWLANAQYPLLVDPLISSVLRLGHESPTGEQTLPQVAYNSVDDEYLLVWQDGRNSGTTGTDIYGQRVAGDGVLLGDNFVINSTSYDQTNPQVAYGGGVYLVVWRHFTSATGAYTYDTQGQLVSNTGQLTGGMLAIDADATEAEFPTDVVYNSTGSQFLVLWQNRYSSGNWDTLGRHVSIGGTVNPTTLAFATSAAYAETSARGVYNPTLDQYLVTWAYWGSPNRDIRGRLLTGSIMGSQLVIADDLTFQDLPDVSYLPDVARYLVVWHDNRNAATNGYDIYAQKVDTTGGLDGSNYALVNGNASEERPRLGQGADNTVFLVWQRNDANPDWNLYGRSLSASGLVTAESFTTFSGKGSQTLPAVAGDGNGNYLTVWQDDRNGNNDIYARRLASEGVLGGDFMVHPTPGGQSQPRVTYNPDDDEYLVVWTHGGTDNDLYGQRISGNGALIENNILIAGGTDSQTQAQLAYGGGQYLVAWAAASEGNNDVKAQFVSRTGGLGSEFTVASSSASEAPTDVVYNTTQNKFLVVWHTISPLSNQNIWGRHVLSNGQMETTVQFTTDPATESYPDTAYNPTTDEYFIAWDYNGTKVYGYRVDSNLVVQGGSTPIEIAGGIGGSANVDVAYLPAADRYVMVWTQNADIYGRLVDANGVPDGNSYLISAQPASEGWPKVAVNNLGGALVVWMASQTGVASGIYGRQLDGSGHPYGNSFVVADMAGSQIHPFLASNGQTRYLVAWDEVDVFAALFQPLQETAVTYTYDPLYRLIEADYNGTLNASYQYRYDAVGNMTFFTETVGITVTRVQRYFNAANQLIDSFDYAAGTTSFTYDGNGNLIQQILPGGAATWLSYYYNQRNLLTQSERTEFEVGTTLLAEYRYDGANNRLRQIDYTGGSSVTTTYTNDVLGLSQVLVTNDGTTQTYNLFGMDLISQDNGTETRYLLADGLGSVRTEMVGNAVETVTTYEPFGNAIAQTGTSGTVYGFTGEQQDSATNLVYLRARYYHPSLNQFQSRDPFPGYVMMPASQNGYSYVHNNPIKYADPSGLCIVGYSGEVRMNQYPYGTSGVCANTEHWIIEANAAIFAYNPHESTARRTSGFTLFNGNDWGGAHHKVSNDFCDENDTYVTCWNRKGILLFDDHEQIDMLQFAQLEKTVYEDLYNATELADASRAVYDTPFFNADQEDTIICLDSSCFPRSHVNYFAQGAWSARVGESRATLYFIIQTWKRVKYGEESVPGTLLAWADHGYFGYLEYEKEQLTMPWSYQCDNRKVG